MVCVWFSSTSKELKVWGRPQDPSCLHSVQVKQRIVGQEVLSLVTSGTCKTGFYLDLKPCGALLPVWRVKAAEVLAQLYAAHGHHLKPRNTAAEGDAGNAESLWHRASLCSASIFMSGHLSLTASCVSIIGWILLFGLIVPDYFYSLLQMK